MFVFMCKSKIHRATVTESNLNYEGSITIDKKLMEAADLLPYEKVEFLNINTGARAQSYVIEGEPGSGVICCNGALARLAEIGDLVIILSYCLIEKERAQQLVTKVVHVNHKNQII